MSKTNQIKGLFSCIIPVYNREHLINDCLNSVLSQSYPNYEIILVNDGSTDETPQILEQFAEQSIQKIKLINQANTGPGGARQTGLNHAQGEFIQFLDSDDLIMPKKFALVAQAFANHPDADIVYSVTHYYHIDNPGKYVVWKETGQQIDAILPGFLIERAWATATPIYRYAILSSVGDILPLCSEEDLEYECRIGLQTPKLIHVNQHLTDIRHHHGERFSLNYPDQKKLIKHRIQARKQILASAKQFQIDPEHPAMQFFARSMFLIARQSAQMNLISESKSALAIARAAGAGLNIKDKLGIFIFQLLSLLLGAKRAAHMLSRAHLLFHKNNIF